jgi:hypothetical protein
MTVPIKFSWNAFAALLLVLCMPLPGIAAAPNYIEKQLDSSTLKLPLLDGFPAACEENQMLAQRAAALTPKSSTFASCFVERGAWRAFVSGKGSSLYPYIAVSVAKPHSSGPLSVADFGKLRDAARTQMGDLVANRTAAMAQMREQESRLRSQGSDLRRDNFRMDVTGFFDVPDAPQSFSFLSIRGATVAEGGQQRQVCEVTATSTLLVGGKVVNALVVDECDASFDGTRAREITARWLSAFRQGTAATPR